MENVHSAFGAKMQFLADILRKFKENLDARSARKHICKQMLQKSAKKCHRMPNGKRARAGKSRGPEPPRTCISFSRALMLSNCHSHRLGWGASIAEFGKKHFPQNIWKPQDGSIGIMAEPRPNPSGPGPALLQQLLQQLIAEAIAECQQ